jgi:hypothetical protein
MMRESDRGHAFRTATRLALVHALFLGALGFQVMLPFLRKQDTKTDFAILWLSAREAWRDGNPYASRLRDPYGDSIRAPGAAPLPDLETPSRVGNLNPPFQTVLLAPLGLLEYGAALWIWNGLTLAAAVAVGFVIARTWLPHRPLEVWGPAFSIVVLVYFPSAANAWISQLGSALALAAALSFWFLARGRWTALGATLGVVAGLKVFVGLFGVFFLLTRRWRSLAAFTGAFLVTVLAGGLSFGWDVYPQYQDMLGQVTWHSSSWNVSMFGVATRLLGSGSNDGALVDLPHLGLLVGQGLAVVLGLAYCAVILAGERRRGGADPALSLSLTFVMMLVLSPLGWWYYLTALLSSCAALVAAARDRAERTVAIVAVVLFLALSSVWQRLYMSSDLGTEGYEAWKPEMSVLAVLILAGTHGWLLLRPRADEHAHESAAEVPRTAELRSAGA